MVRIASLAAAAALLLAPTLVRAEDIAAFETEGAADAAAADPRTAALDEAFARAVTLVLVDLVDPATRKANQAAIDQNLVQRSRLWVANFKVATDTTAGGQRLLTVLVRVDRDKVRAKLAELAIPTLAPAPAGPRTVAVLLRLTSPSGVVATYGAGATQDLPGFAGLAGSLRGAGMTVKKAPAIGPPARGDGDLPLADAVALQLAADTRVEQLAIAGVTLGDGVPLRGIPDVGVLVTATVRVIGRADGKLVGQGTARVAALGIADAAIAPAVNRALVAAASDVLPPHPDALAPSGGFEGDDAPATTPGVVLVRMAARTPWPLVQGELKYLSGAKGVAAVSLRRISAGGWVLGVVTAESVDRVAQLAKKGSAKVRVVGSVVELTPGTTP